ncbi:hypothetical protein NP493_711g00000 [Ridgeia piscesae]|uniref:Concentrative nucleoside transporter C-terminal domain-containing protein n=1 Tax=Ridgeia piscesae TaxID=27915 RepID=A0AAD9KQX4_RIDPI|nr:hypothetical protein NP493_711g00000 [Ridgeia piscesae]
MGVEIEDANRVGSLLGTKVFVDEFVSFRQLQEMVENGEIAERSVVLATYACCGFGSIAAVGIYVGALISVAPERRGDISEVALRAVINGNLASFLTACIAGILYKGEGALIDTPSVLSNEAMYNATASIMSTMHPYMPNV